MTTIEDVIRTRNDLHKAQKVVEQKRKKFVDTIRDFRKTSRMPYREIGEHLGLGAVRIHNIINGRK